MSVRLRLGAITLLVLAMLVPLAGSAQAAQAPPDPTSIANSEIVSVDLTVTDSGVTAAKNVKGTKTGVTPMTGSPSFSGCKEITGTYKAYNVVGDLQISFTQVADWCWSAGAITFKSSDFHQTSPGEFWSYNQLTDSSSASNSGMWIRSRTAWFHQCFPGGYGCWRNAYPWVKFYMYGNGTYSMSWGA